MDSAAEPFDRGLRRLRRDRSAGRFAEADFIKEAISEEIAERVRLLDRRFDHLLDLGCHDGRLGRRIEAEWRTFADAGFRNARAAGGVVCDEDRLPFAAGSFDLIVSAAALHGVNDLPGALVQLRRALKPGGFLIAGFVSGATLAPLRLAFTQAESELSGGASPRVSPMVDPAQGAALLQRAGFADPVADIDRRDVRYGNLFSLLRDLRAMGETSILAAREKRPMRRGLLLRAAELFQEGADADGRVTVPVEIVCLTARAASGAG